MHLPGRTAPLIAVLVQHNGAEPASDRLGSLHQQFVAAVAGQRDRRDAVALRC